MDTRLSFSAADMAEIRFAVSPLWEVLTSFRLLRGAPELPSQRRWAGPARERLAEAGLDRGWLALLAPPGSYVADLLTPAPRTSFPTLEAELAAVRATPPARVRDELGRLAKDRPGLERSPRYRLLYDEPAAMLAKVTAEIETYWELALAPYWQRIRQLLEADLFHRARLVAEYGAGYVLGELHESVSWDDGALRLVRRHCGLLRGQAGSGLVLVPTAFAWSRVLTVSVAPEPPQLAYPARGIGALWEPRPCAVDAVAGVLGRSRALLLQELDTPASTSALAAQFGLSAAGVSQHLTALRDARLVTAHRVGRSVLYARTAVADALLSPS
ncbi:hypothetical protein SRB5_63390 [Streptomyces sp. RB5]|uniref:HTH arsR-type domain-containing protein n=1 Tax=Streptomyces smaragdinus TaxID=2585196 RepID=A0A7K0CRM8_9ACTN|nr:DUF5937 family protein [Streptomyces smaragdinus]MQY16146.1 hypothetical protein [Streptomyces smaragdinus]